MKFPDLPVGTHFRFGPAEFMDLAVLFKKIGPAQFVKPADSSGEYEPRTYEPAFANYGEDVTPDPVEAAWEVAHKEVDGLLAYKDDWDGEGALPVDPALIDPTHRLLTQAKEFGYGPPNHVYLTAGGTVMVEWHYRDGRATVANVRDGKAAEVIYRVPGQRPEFVKNSLLLTETPPR